MIDLKKPIRRKGDNKQVKVEPAFLVDWAGYLTTHTADDFEREYENIPEPRKPREWQSFFNPVTNDYVVRFKEPLRVIEWPKDAPLPDWPEGYP